MPLHVEDLLSEPEQELVPSKYQVKMGLLYAQNTLTLQIRYVERLTCTYLPVLLSLVCKMEITLDSFEGLNKTMAGRIFSMIFGT